MLGAEKIAQWLRVLVTLAEDLDSQHQHSGLQSLITPVLRDPNDNCVVHTHACMHETHTHTVNKPKHQQRLIRSTKQCLVQYKRFKYYIASSAIN